jgi:hypothetical protein
MQTFIFAVGFFVSLMVVYGLFSLVPREIRPPDEVVYYGSSEKSEKKS